MQKANRTRIAFRISRLVGSQLFGLRKAQYAVASTMMYASIVKADSPRQHSIFCRCDTLGCDRTAFAGMWPATPLDSASLQATGNAFEWPPSLFGLMSLARSSQPQKTHPKRACQEAAGTFTACLAPLLSGLAAQSWACGLAMVVHLTNTWVKVPRGGAWAMGQVQRHAQCAS
jgi:hypothetical protein